MAGSLEKKHQHVSIIFKIVPDIANHRSKAIRRINPDLLQCSFVPSLFDNMINSNNNPSNEDAGKACAYITKCVESAAVVRTRKRSKLWFDSECFALKQRVRDQYTVVKS